jgi:hypothetical protein
MAPEVEADPTVAGAMRGLSALRLLAHHLQELAEVTLSVDVSDWREGPGLRIVLHQQSNASQVARLADSLGLPTPTAYAQPDGSMQHWSEGTWRGYEIRLATVVYADTTEGARL